MCLLRGSVPSPLPKPQSALIHGGKQSLSRFTAVVTTVRAVRGGASPTRLRGRGTLTDPFNGHLDHCLA